MQPIMKVTVTASLLGALLLTLPALANNIRVENIAIRNQDTTEKTMDVEFDLNWENSWRNEINHDAAWVFVKFRAPDSNHWEHAYLSTDNADHSAPGGVVKVGTSDLGASTNAVGAFVSSANNRNGAVAYARTSLRWNYGDSGYNWAAGAEVDVSVQAFEMVYVAEGAFKVGCGGSQTYAFTDGSWESGTNIPFQITSEAALTITNSAGNLWATGAIGDAGTLPAAFPKGYGAFYCMKYAISQDQYVGFLNRLSYAQQNTLIAGSPASAPGTYSYDTTWRNEIHIAESGTSPDTPAVYATGLPYVTCNYLQYEDGAAYAQWAGLRPMTELEFEKAARGPLEPVPNEYAWGTASQTQGANYFDLGLPTEGAGSGNVHWGYSAEPQYRVGIFATANSTREEAGASYWGALNMSGDPMERMVTVANDTGRGFEGSHGDGTLSDAGYAMRSDWPGYDSGAGAVTGATGCGYRGIEGSYSRYLAELSDRNAIHTDGGRSTRAGIRLVRTAP